MTLLLQTFVDGIDVGALEPVRGIDQKVDGKEAPFQLSQAVSIGGVAASIVSFIRMRGRRELGLPGTVGLVDSECVEQHRSREGCAVEIHHVEMW